MRCRSVLIAVCLLTAVPAACLFGDSAVLVNRTGMEIELVQAAPDGESGWGDDLIPSSVIPDGEAAVLDLPGAPPWAIRLVDTGGTVYVLYGAVPGPSGKIAVGPEHQIRLSLVAPPVRGVTIANRTGLPMTSLKISPVGEETWGEDVLQGRTLPDTRTVELTLDVPAGVLEFDLLFTLLSDGRDIPYVREDVVITDASSLVLSLR